MEDEEDEGGVIPHVAVFGCINLLTFEAGDVDSAAKACDM